MKRSSVNLAAKLDYKGVTDVRIVLEVLKLQTKEVVDVRLSDFEIGLSVLYNKDLFNP